MTVNRLELFINRSITVKLATTCYFLKRLKFAPNLDQWNKTDKLLEGRLFDSMIFSGVDRGFPVGGVPTYSVADPGFHRGGGANSPGVASTYDFAKFSQKLHEIERIWAPPGGSLAPPTSATDTTFAKLSQKLHEIEKMLGRRSATVLFYWEICRKRAKAGSHPRLSVVGGRLHEIEHFGRACEAAPVRQYVIGLH